MLADANKLMADARFKGMKAVASLAGHTSSVWSVAFSPDGQHIVSGNGDNLMKVWLFVTGTLSFYYISHNFFIYANNQHCNFYNLKKKLIWPVASLFEIVSVSYLLFRLVYCRKLDLQSFSKKIWNIIDLVKVLSPL